MANLLKDIVTSQSGDRNPNGQIQKLKKQVSALKQQVGNLQQKLPPVTKLRAEGSNLVITEQIQQNGRTWESKPVVVEMGESFKELVTLIEPAMQIARAAALGQDVVTRRQKAHELDSTGKPTKELAKDENGKQIYLPNVRDKVLAISEILMEDPDCAAALRTIGAKLSDAVTVEKIKAKSHQVAQVNLIPPSKPRGQNLGR